MNKRKKIQSIERGRLKLTCYYDCEWQEYQVRVYINGVYQGDESTYYTNEKEDAFDTMNAMINDISARWETRTECEPKPQPPIDMARINHAFARIRAAIAEADQAINAKTTVCLEEV